MKRALCLAVVLLLAGCAGATHTTSSIPATTTAATGPARVCSPQPGAGRMGVCVPKPKGLGPPRAVAGRLGVDVSSYQGRPDWQVAKRHIVWAIVKAAEGGYGQDSSFAYNWRQLRRLKVPHSAYYFARPGSCTAQADEFVAVVDRAGGFDSLPPVLDAEVADTGGRFADCFIRRAASRARFAQGIVYTSPGTWGGGTPHAHLWVATYGNSFGCVWTCSPVAWQFTGDNAGPSPHSIPGVGAGIDISQDRGLLRLQRAPACPSGAGTVGAPWLRGPCKRATTGQAVRFLRGHPYWARHHPHFLRTHPYTASRCARRWCRTGG
jgi:hypothetical protein